MNIQRSICRNALASAILVALVGLQLPSLAADEATAAAQTVKPAHGAPESSQRYIKSQTFAGRVFPKDNNIWAYTKEFADTFGMPAQFVEDIQGVEAVAFRSEPTSYQQCGWGGNEQACMPVIRCVIDLHFDERRTPLPWATASNSDWLPINSSLRWLRSDQPNRAGRGLVPVGVLPNEGVQAGLVPFADSVSKREAIFTTNATDSTATAEGVSGWLLTLGFTRHYYDSLTIVSLDYPCLDFSRKVVNIRLDSKVRGAYEMPIARFNRVTLPPQFVNRIRAEIARAGERREDFYREVLGFPPRSQPSVTRALNSDLR